MSDAPLSPDAPLPWLGAAEVSDVRQPWTSIAPDDSQLQVNFTYHKVWQRRAWWRLLLLRLPQTFVIFPMIYFAVVIGITGANALRHGFSLSTFVAFCKSSVPVTVIMVPINLASSFYLNGKAKGAVGLSATVSASSVTLAGLRAPLAVAWSQIAAIQFRDGDIYIVPKWTSVNSFAITRNAFTDDDAANRFYRALVALWQSNGNMATVPEAVRMEFAPQPDALPSV